MTDKLFLLSGKYVIIKKYLKYYSRDAKTI